MLSFMKESKLHWEQVYAVKSAAEVSWTQAIPVTSLDFFHDLKLSKKAKIIDIGGGESRFVDYLLTEGYENVSVLDISEKALERTRQRLGTLATKVNWIVSDITQFKANNQYDLWHDRATFHFLTSNEQISQYLDIVQGAVSGYMIVATFSENGPEKCSGLPVKQYSKQELIAQFQYKFNKINCKNEDHITPFNTVQNFTFCSFQKRPVKATERV
jgi:cyclopropane fatty-acyl-phospholipid synthase-like methyltransferase